MPVFQVRQLEYDEGDSERTREMDLCLSPSREAFAIRSLSGCIAMVSQTVIPTIEILTWDQERDRNRWAVDGIVLHFQTC